MAAVEITATLDGVGSQVAGATADYAAVSALSGDSDQVVAGIEVSMGLALDGDSDQVVAGVGVSTSLTLDGGSTSSAIAGVLFDVALTMAGSSDAASTGPAADYAAAAALLGSSAMSGNARNSMPATASMAADSVFTVASSSDLILIAALVGNSALTIDPTKTQVTGFSRGPQVPVTARPPAIPTIRVVPPAPMPASYTIDPRNRRREER